MLIKSRGKRQPQSRYNSRLGALAQSCERKFYNKSTVCKPSFYHCSLPQRLHCVGFDGIFGDFGQISCWCVV